MGDNAAADSNIVSLHSDDHGLQVRLRVRLRSQHTVRAKSSEAASAAEKVGVRNQAVSSWELGNANPSPENMVTLIDVLELDPDAAAAAYLEAWRR